MVGLKSFFFAKSQTNLFQSRVTNFLKDTQRASSSFDSTPPVGDFQVGVGVGGRKPYAPLTTAERAAIVGERVFNSNKKLIILSNVLEDSK